MVQKVYDNGDLSVAVDSETYRLNQNCCTPMPSNALDAINRTDQNKRNGKNNNVGPF